MDLGNLNENPHEITMPKLQKEQQEVSKREFKKYTNKELQAFDEYIERFFEEKEITVPNGTTMTRRVLNKHRLMVDYGAVTESGAVRLIVTGTDKDGHDAYELPHRIEEFENIYSQHDKWKFVENQKIESLTEMANQIGTW